MAKEHKKYNENKKSQECCNTMTAQTEVRRLLTNFTLRIKTYSLFGVILIILERLLFNSTFLLKPQLRLLVYIVFVKPVKKTSCYSMVGLILLNVI